MQTEVISDIQKAKDYLRQVFPIAHTPDHIKEKLGIGSSVATLGRKLRAASVGDNPETTRTYYRNARSEDIAIYASNQNYKPPGTPVKAPRTASSLYFYTKLLRGLPSPYYLFLEALKADIRNAKLATPGLNGFHVWSGTTEAPVLVEVVK